MLALTPISPFRPRRWSGAILPDDIAVCFRVLEPEKRPVSAVADQFEVRDVGQVEVSLDRERSLTLLFDPEHALDERIAMEQFAHLSRRCISRSLAAFAASIGASLPSKTDCSPVAQR